VRGGDTLTVSFEGTAESHENVTLTGPADFVFEGTMEIGT
jgi:diaminopimelate epimerase